MVIFFPWTELPDRILGIKIGIFLVLDGKEEWYVILTYLIQIPIISKMIETAKRPLSQVENQSGSHTLKYIWCKVGRQQLGVNGVELVVIANITPILIPANLAQWATLNLSNVE